MEKVNLRDLYPDVYKTDHFVEVAEDVLIGNHTFPTEEQGFF